MKVDNESKSAVESYIFSNVDSDHTIQAEFYSIVGINSDVTSKEVRIFPNPASELLNIEIPSIKGNLSIEIFDIYGRILKKKEAGNSSTTINLSELHCTGMILVRVLEGEEVISVRKVFLK